MTHKNKGKDQDRDRDTLPLIKPNISPNHNQNLFYSTANKNENFYNNYDHHNPSKRLNKILSKHSNSIGEIEIDHS